MAEIEHFKISSALKDLIGRELITDEYIAVFELVKNAFDAYATEVDLIFETIYENENKRKIIIKDNGKGMDFYDLKNKWLFVAYSAKTLGLEDYSEETKEDYRNKIKSDRIFAGAKGIGRFSCDRLGTKLNLISLKDAKNAKIENLVVDWEKFEIDQKKEFININVNHQNLEKINYKNFNSGTILEITGLRSTWNRDKLLKLKHSLEKLVNPDQENDTRNFVIELIVDEERNLDKEEKLERNIVNGPIKNFLFETLKLKTTQIKTEIIENGLFIRTTLLDRGKPIYTIKEKNPYLLQSNILIHLFQLNRAAKINFSKIMGISPMQYGSIFLYKNGFRIYPFGESGEDRLGIDKRKQQGYRRFLGTRDLIGRIEINDKENIDNFRETTSRDGGLIKNTKYENLIDFFYDKSLRRLERYVVDLIKWGDPIKETEIELKPDDIKKEIILLISNIARESDVLELEYDKNFLDVIIEREQEENVQRNLKNVEILAEKTNNPELQKRVRKVVKQFKEHNEAFQEIQREARVSEVLLKDKSKELKQEQKKNLFLLSTAKNTTPEVLGLIHHIELETNEIYNTLDLVVDDIKNKKISYDILLKELSNIKTHSDKILKISKLITRSNFNTETNFQVGDLVGYIEEYIDFYSELSGGKINISIKSDVKSFRTRFSIIEISIIIDNLVSNSIKAKAKNILINLYSRGVDLYFVFSDDGIGVNEDLQKNMFELGITSTAGSGIGLYTVKDLLKKNSGHIKFLGNGKYLAGASLELRFKR